MARILLVLPTSTYRASDFLDAARALDVEVVIASEEQQALAATMGDRFLRIDLCDPEVAAGEIARHRAKPDAIVGVDEQGVEVAAIASEMLSLPHNPPSSVAITRDKTRLRAVLTAAGLPQPQVMTDGDVRFPCVVKATTLSGSRGVIRANDAAELESALSRVRSIAGDDDAVIVESYVPGAEVALEGLLDGGTLYVLALFDKPDPLEGPFFEETIYVTPSRHPADARHAIERTIADACSAIGLSEGPIHAEVRVPPDGPPVVLEVAARSIGGLCSRALKFGAGVSLEEVILRHALGKDLGDLQRARSASGVMMIPIPKTGTLRAVDGVDNASAVSGIEGIEITIPRGQPVQALPEGDRYLGFIFASGARPEDVEASLRDAFSRLSIEID
jgi:biotin carboxylase